eukprot:gene43130-53534_t
MLDGDAPEVRISDGNTNLCTRLRLLLQGAQVRISDGNTN